MPLSCLCAFAGRQPAFPVHSITPLRYCCLSPLRRMQLPAQAASAALASFDSAHAPTAAVRLAGVMADGVQAMTPTIEEFAQKVCFAYDCNCLERLYFTPGRPCCRQCKAFAFICSPAGMHGRLCCVSGQGVRGCVPWAGGTDRGRAGRRVPGQGQEGEACGIAFNM